MPQVLFKKSKKPSKQQQMDHDDIWDDSLLIKAYEESVKLRNEDVAKKIAMKTNKKQKNPETDEISSNSSDEDEQTADDDTECGLKVGDYVRSTFADDGVDYEAEITEINESGSTCRVRYIGYGNEEKVKIEDLVESWGEDARAEQIQIAEADSATANTEDVPDTTHVFKTPFPVPPMPPMPPAVFDNTKDSEYLSSMLMSWYMSGYYTGLYYGRKQAQDEAKLPTSLKKSGSELKPSSSKNKKTKKM